MDLIEKKQKLRETDLRTDKLSNCYQHQLLFIVAMRRFLSLISFRERIQMPRKIETFDSNRVELLILLIADPPPLYCEYTADGF